MKKTDQGWHCEQCNKTYKIKKDIRYHYRAVHSGTYLYVCEICGRGTNNTANMKTYMMRNHGGGLNLHQAEVHLPVSNQNSESDVTLQVSRKAVSKLLQASLDGQEVYHIALTPKT